jgi:putative membrane protein
MMNGGWSWWWVVPMMVSTALFVGAIVAVVIAVMRSDALPHQRTPEELLRERFARGEIDADEYAHRLDALHEGPYSTRR